MTTDHFCFYLQNRLIQTSQTGGQWYSDTPPFSIIVGGIVEEVDGFYDTDTWMLRSMGSGIFNLLLPIIFFFLSSVDCDVTAGEMLSSDISLINVMSSKSSLFVNVIKQFSFSSSSLSAQQNELKHCTRKRHPSLLVLICVLKVLHSS
jgi:hypothetical protein